MSYYYNLTIFHIKRWIQPLLLIALFSYLPLQAQTTPTQTLRVVSYNIRHGLGLDNKIDFARLGTVIKSVMPDVVAVQEVDSSTTRANYTYGLGLIAKQIGYVDTYGPCIPYQTGKYGVGILSKKAPIRTRQVPLPGASEARTLLITEFDNYVFACTHLSLDEQERNKSATIIANTAAEYNKPFIVAGDWNAEPTSAFLTAMKEKFQILTDTSKPTFPANKPTDCIDYIAIYKDTPLEGGEMSATTDLTYVLNEPTASDHRPVMAKVTFTIPQPDWVTPFFMDAATTNGPRYDLQGRRINSTSGNGIFIQNGKKYIKR